MYCRRFIVIEDVKVGRYHSRTGMAPLPLDGYQALLPGSGGVLRYSRPPVPAYPDPVLPVLQPRISSCAEHSTRPHPNASGVPPTVLANWTWRSRNGYYVVALPPAQWESSTPPTYQNRDTDDPRLLDWSGTVWRQPESEFRGTFFSCTCVECVWGLPTSFHAY